MHRLQRFALAGSPPSEREDSHCLAVEEKTEALSERASAAKGEEKETAASDAPTYGG